MRPIALSLQAFGPFVQPQRLDFRCLGEQRLFLIAGPTGAGKTTLLDAITFALYGTSSGAERDADELRSQQADPHSLTEVRFDFSIGRRRYRVERVPRQRRAKLRGEGTTAEPASATLWDRTETADDAAEGHVLASGYSKVTEHIETLIGFRGEQFRQVILLPQGRFRELLTAGAGTREQILATLFHTEHYGRVQQALQARAEQLRKHLERLEIQRGTQLANSGCADEGELTARVADIESELARLDAEVEAHKRDEQQAIAALEAARAADQRLRALADARTGLAALEQAGPQIEALALELDAARRADRLQDLHRQLEQRRTTLEGLLDEHRAARAGAESERQRCDEAQAALTRETAAEGERESLRTEIHGLDALRGQVAALAEAQDQLNSAERTAASTESDDRAAVEAVEEARRRLREGAASRERLAEPAARLELLRNRAETLESQVGQRRSLDSAEADRHRLAAELLEAERTEAIARAALRDARDRHELLLRRWQDGQALHLAATLTPGAPCPVCGATEHPAPAAGDVETPDEPALNTAKLDAAQAESRLERAVGGCADARRRIAELDSRIAALREHLGDWATGGVEDMAAALHGLRRELTAAQDAAEAIVLLDAERADAELRLKGLEQTAELAGERHRTAAQALATARRLLEERALHVPDHLRDPSTLEATLTQRRRSLDDAERALEQARTAAELSARSLTAAETKEQALARQYDAAAEAFRAESERWGQRRTEAGFSNDEDFAAARREQAHQGRIEARIDDHRDALTGARTTLENAEIAAAGLTQPDLAALEQSAAAATAAREQAQRRAAESTAEAKRLTALAGSLAELRKALDDHHARYAVAGRLQEVANGKKPNRISFQRFVLGALLDDVLRAASERFLAMSRGRYRLLRGTDGGDRRSLGGLDLVVEDGYTGMTRPVATLSGGEGFQAALSLALGLAETVQAYAGGVHLDAIFIDEGFGSLDPESLELAVDTLMDLQQSGRLVGVISHVPELKERLDARLEVSAARGGSSASFVVP
jgi:exonuclease SbcC